MSRHPERRMRFHRHQPEQRTSVPARVVPAVHTRLSDIEDLLAKRGLDMSYETVRRWVVKFEPLFARALHLAHGALPMAAKVASKMDE